MSGDLKELRVKCTFDMASLNKSASELKSTLNKLANDISKSFKIDLSNAIDTSSISRIKNSIQNQLSGINVSIGTTDNTTKVSKPSSNTGSLMGGAGSIAAAAGMSNASSGIKEAGNTLIAGGREVSKSSIQVKDSIEGFTIVIGQLEKTLIALEAIMNDTKNITSGLEKLQELQVLRSYTKDALGYVEKIKNLINDIKSGKLNIGDSETETQLRNIRDISDNIIDNFNSFGNFKFFNGDEAKALIGDLEEANDSLKEFIKNKNALSDFSIFDNDTPIFGGPDSSIDDFIRDVTNDLKEIANSEESLKRYTEDMANDMAANLNLVAPSMKRIKEEAAVLNQALKMENSPENAIGFLKALQNIENAYKGTLSSIKAEDLSKILNDKFDFAIDPSSINDLGNNMNEVLNVISRDTISISDSIENIADSADLSAKRIAMAMRQAFAPLQSMRDVTATNIVTETMNQLGSTAQNNIPVFERLKNTFKELFNNASLDRLNVSMDNFKKSSSNLKTSFSNLKNSIKDVFNIKDDGTNKNLDKMDNKANKVNSSMKKLITTVGSLFGIYQLFGFIGNSITAGMDAIETDNLYNTVFKSTGAIEELNSWISNLNKTLGLSSTELKKYSSTLFSIGNSMGVPRDAAIEMSKTLTELSYDLASFYNIGTEEAFNKLKSGITGETEPYLRAS